MRHSSYALHVITCVITCVVEYTIDADKTADFERFARAWIALVDKHGGRHHGYFLPGEGAGDRALALPVLTGAAPGGPDA